MDCYPPSKKPRKTLNFEVERRLTSKKVREVSKYVHEVLFAKDLLHIIFSYTKQVTELLRIGSVCKFWHDIANDRHYLCCCY